MKSIKLMIMVEMAMHNIGSHREGAIWLLRFVEVKNKRALDFVTGQGQSRISKFTFRVYDKNIELERVAIEIIDYLDKVVGELLLILECFISNFFYDSN